MAWYKHMELYMFKQQECVVYLETFDKVGDGVVNACIDFRQNKDLSYFSRETGFYNTGATLIELCSLKLGKRLRKGCYYKLNLDLLKNFQLETNNNSILIGGSYDLRKMDQPRNDDQELLQKHGTLDPEELSMANTHHDILFHNVIGGNFELLVKDVGQANWNEFRLGNLVKVVYDAGAEIHASTSRVMEILSSRKEDLIRSKPVLVISHWDMDHIHCLKGLAENDIRECFSKIVCPDKLKSLTSHVILDNFIKALGTANVYCLPLPKRTNGITMHLWKRENRISLYLGESSTQINYSGIVMFVRGEKSSVNFTGDCRLLQAKDVYDKEFEEGLDTQEHILIAPHHGGDCGARFRHYSSPCNIVEISVGKNNSYGHPQKDMLDYLRLLGKVEQTKDAGDILRGI